MPEQRLGRAQLLHTINSKMQLQFRVKIHSNVKCNITYSSEQQVTVRKQNLFYI